MSASTLWICATCFEKVIKSINTKKNCFALVFFSSTFNSQKTESTSSPGSWRFLKFSIFVVLSLGSAENCERLGDLGESNVRWLCDTPRETVVSHQAIVVVIYGSSCLRVGTFERIISRLWRIFVRERLNGQLIIVAHHFRLNSSIFSPTLPSFFRFQLNWNSTNQSIQTLHRKNKKSSIEHRNFVGKPKIRPFFAQTTEKFAAIWDQNVKKFSFDTEKSSMHNSWQLKRGYRFLHFHNFVATKLRVNFHFPSLNAPLASMNTSTYNSLLCVHCNSLDSMLSIISSLPRRSRFVCDFQQQPTNIYWKLLWFSSHFAELFFLLFRHETTNSIQLDE